MKIKVCLQRLKRIIYSKRITRSVENLCTYKVLDAHVHTHTYTSARTPSHTRTREPRSVDTHTRTHTHTYTQTESLLSIASLSHTLGTTICKSVNFFFGYRKTIKNNSCRKRKLPLESNQQKNKTRDIFSKNQRSPFCSARSLARFSPLEALLTTERNGAPHSPRCERERPSRATTSKWRAHGIAIDGDVDFGTLHTLLTPLRLRTRARAPSTHTHRAAFEWAWLLLLLLLSFPLRRCCCCCVAVVAQCIGTKI